MEFFGSTPGMPFTLFGALYFALLFIVLGITLLMYKYRMKLRQSSHKKAMRYIFAAILFANMTIYYGGLMLVGEYDIKKHLPLEFCFITGYILLYILISNNKNNLYSVLYYCTLIGPLPAMLFPNLLGSFDRYVFYQFVISHHVMLLISFYCIIVLQYKVEVKSSIKAFLYGNVVFILVSMLNSVWGSNYIMQQKLPDHIIELFPFVTYFNHPAFWLEACGLLMLIPGILLARKFQGDTKVKALDIPGVALNKV